MRPLTGWSLRNLLLRVTFDCSVHNICKELRIVASFRHRQESSESQVLSDAALDALHRHAAIRKQGVVLGSLSHENSEVHTRIHALYTNLGILSYKPTHAHYQYPKLALRPNILWSPRDCSKIHCALSRRRLASFVFRSPAHAYQTSISPCAPCFGLTVQVCLTSAPSLP